MGLYSFDANYRNGEITAIAGVDEAGRGPWAGPVVAAAVVLDAKTRINGLDDSKKLTPRRREMLFLEIKARAQYVGVSVVPHETIDQLNILQATYKGMKDALYQVWGTYQLVLVDGWKIPGLTIPQHGVIDGDGKSASIAAASIIAKVTRDRIMQEFAGAYPQYGFEDHKGYGTAQHIQALRKFGPCQIHRKSYAPIKEALALWQQSA
jgi:ribonuclease HII